ncbi:UNKNOWN [Stylonychia lemnae]|uniref:Uncharacterized protein n=1 Tax=Stylonychia lemnae TaxID=5949 RepID=A0A078B1V6_STYLE|nr:UNKNOWN [Stylonychia lemnae]|eukprot:CDW88540.1 UNKNOWN [Stylonychia lemnae]
MRKVILQMSLTLAFECLFKLMFRYRRPYVNSFQKMYRQVRDKNGELMNVQISNDERYFKKKRLDDYTHSDKNDIKPIDSWVRTWLRKLCEFLVAALLSVTIQSESFDGGWSDPQPEVDSSTAKYNYFNHFFRRLLIADESEKVSLLFKKQVP